LGRASDYLDAAALMVLEQRLRGNALPEDSERRGFVAGAARNPFAAYGPHSWARPASPSRPIRA
jgi:hypothetical protein